MRDLVIGTCLMKVLGLILEYFTETEVKMKSLAVNSFMAQFVFGVGTLHHKEVFSTVRYLTMIILSRNFTSTFVSSSDPYSTYYTD